MLKNFLLSNVIAISFVALTGCGGSGSSSGSASIVGSWATDCHNSRVKILTFNSDKSGTHQKIVYGDPECKYIDHEETSHFTYKIGNDTKGADGKAAKELDLTVQEEGFTYYTMYRISNDNLFVADGGDDSKKGESADEREDNFSGVTPFKKIK